MYNKSQNIYYHKGGKWEEQSLPLYEERLFGSLADDWFLAIEARVKESSYIKYHNLWKTYIAPELSAVPLCQLSPVLIEQFCRRLLVSGGAKGNGLSPKTVSDVLSLIRNIVNFSEQQGVPVPFQISKNIVRQAPKAIRVLSLAEQQTLCNYLYEHPNLRNFGILLCLFTGLRIGEICALRWEDISLPEQTICVKHTMQRIQNGHPTETKTKIVITAPKSICSIRTIPLPDSILPILLTHQEEGNAFFLTGCSSCWLEPRAMQYHFDKIMKCCNIENATYHCLRHTFATRCIELGFDVKSLSEILGHASVNITMNRYVHPSMQLKRENMQRLAPLLSVK